MRNVVRYPDDASMAHEGAKRIVEHAQAAIAARGVFTISLSGGNTPRLTFRLLATEPYRSQMQWDKIQFFWGDERCVPPDHPDSNYKMAVDEMLSKVTVPPDHIHRMEGEHPDPPVAAAAYETKMREVFAPLMHPGDKFPRFDLVLLGLGPDGHTLSLFPGSKAMNTADEWVVANWVEKFKTWRITMTAPLTNHAASVLFQIEGADKDDALHGILEGPYQPEKYPAQLIQPIDGDCDWLIAP